MEYFQQASKTWITEYIGYICKNYLQTYNAVEFRGELEFSFPDGGTVCVCFDEQIRVGTFQWQ